MNFEKVAVKNVKRTTSSIVSLSPLSVLTGPNECGKSTVVEAVRLGATGKSSEGSSKKKVEALLSGKAEVILSGKDWWVKWWMDTSPKREGEDYQGGLPVSPSDFFDLSGDKQLSLLGSSVEIDRISERIRGASEEIKTLKGKAEATPPTLVAPYTGPPIATLQKEIGEIGVALANHRRAMGVDTTKLKRLEESREKLSGVLGVYAKLEVDLKNAGASVPPYVMAAVKAGGTYGDLLGRVNDILEWVNERVGGVKWDFSKAEDVSSTPIPNPVRPPEGYEETKRELEALRGEVERLEYETKGMNGVDTSHLMTPKEFEEAIEKHEKLQGMLRDAMAFEGYAKGLELHQVSVSEAVMKMADLEDEVVALRKKRGEAIDSLKGPVEELANEKLERAGMEPLSLSVVSGARSSELVVEAGVNLRGMARSRRLLYGLCLLSAIHELSDAAKCPVLVAECAEMDMDMFGRALVALGEPKKGNIILEHWSVPWVVPEGVKVIRVGGDSK